MLSELDQRNSRGKIVSVEFAQFIRETSLDNHPLQALLYYAAPCFVQSVVERYAPVQLISDYLEAKYRWLVSLGDQSYATTRKG